MRAAFAFLTESEPSEFPAARGDLKRHGIHLEPELFANLGFDFRELFAFELDDFIAVGADDMAVGRVIDVIGRRLFLLCRG